MAGRQLLQARAHLGAGRARLGAPRWREREHPIGPREQAVHMPKARLGPPLGRRQTGQYRLLEGARDPPTGRQKRLKARMILIDALAQAGDGVRAIVATRAAQSLLPQEVNGLVERAAPVFEGGRWAAHLGDEALEQRGNRVAGPGGGHAAPTPVDTLQREGTRRALVVMGLTGQDGPHLACAQAKTEGKHPDQAVGTGRLAQGHALERTGRFDAHDAESSHPIDDGLRAWRFRAAQSPRQ